MDMVKELIHGGGKLARQAMWPQVAHLPAAGWQIGRLSAGGKLDIRVVPDASQA
jgi:hypothetical protein